MLQPLGCRKTPLIRCGDPPELASSKVLWRAGFGAEEKPTDFT
jgi:hypothetical protein